MPVLDVPRLTAFGHELDTSPSCFGELRSSAHLSDDVEALRERMREDGYLYLPGYLDREEVIAARRGVTNVLADEGLLDPDFPPIEAVVRKEGRSGRTGVRNDVALKVPAVQQLLYAGRMMDFYRRFLGGEVLHFTYTWLRAIVPGRAAAPHLDIVFMGRGTPNLFTAWTPMSDIPLTMGGVMVLEGSNKLERIKNTYGTRDVDTYCTNLPHANAEAWAKNEKRWGGHLSRNAVKLRETLGGRWLTTEYRMGDLLTFSMYTIHGSLDNQSDRVRISSDTRYQLASEPADERWVGEAPTAHGLASRRGRIC